MNTGKFIDVVDHASKMNDRWLFLAAFCLLIVGCGLVIYWLVKQLQALIADHKALQARHHDSRFFHVFSGVEELVRCVGNDTRKIISRVIRFRNELGGGGESV